MNRFLFLLLATLLVGYGCARNAARTPPQGTGGGAAADTLRGTVRIVGAEPATSVTIDAGAAGVVAVTGERRVLEQLSGVEVTIWGERRPTGGFHVARVAVRAAAGVAAVDGILQRSDDGYVLRTVDDVRLPLPHLPLELRAQVGARIWLAGPLDRAPESYGVIR